MLPTLCQLSSDLPLCWAVLVSGYLRAWHMLLPSSVCFDSYGVRSLVRMLDLLEERREMCWSTYTHLSYDRTDEELEL